MLFFPYILPVFIASVLAGASMIFPAFAALKRDKNDIYGLGLFSFFFMRANAIDTVDVIRFFQALKMFCI